MLQRGRSCRLLPTTSTVAAELVVRGETRQWSSWRLSDPSTGRWFTVVMVDVIVMTSTLTHVK
jgi:hypothetical protein